MSSLLSAAAGPSGAIRGVWNLVRALVGGDRAMLPEKAPTTPSPDWTAPKRFGWYVLEYDYLSMTNHANKHDLVYPPLDVRLAFQSKEPNKYFGQKLSGCTI